VKDSETIVVIAKIWNTIAMVEI